MQLESLTVRNFRNLEDLEFKFDAIANVIVGPNAVGKTTILEAIRLAKALLAPRTQSESTHVLMALGASSPQYPNQFEFAAVCSDVSRPAYIRTRYHLSEDELGVIERIIPNMAMSLLQSRRGNTFAQQGPVALVQFLSSDEGKKELAAAEREVTEGVKTLRGDKICTLGITFDPIGKSISGEDMFGQLVVGTLDNQLPPSQALFSYFPADAQCRPEMHTFKSVPTTSARNWNPIIRRHPRNTNA